jgi:hypothetical protein
MVAGVSPKEAAAGYRCSAAVAAREIRRSAMSSAAFDSPMVEPVTEEDL